MRAILDIVLIVLDLYVWLLIDSAILSGVTSRLKQVAVDGDPRQLGATLKALMAAKAAHDTK